MGLLGSASVIFLAQIQGEKGWGGCCWRGEDAAYAITAKSILSRSLRISHSAPSQPSFAPFPTLFCPPPTSGRWLGIPQLYVLPECPLLLLCSSRYRGNAHSAGDCTSCSMADHNTVLLVECFIGQPQSLLPTPFVSMCLRMACRSYFWSNQKLHLQPQVVSVGYSEASVVGVGPA